MLTQEEFIRRAREKYGDKFDYSKVVYTGINNKVCIICPEHGEFLTTPDVHLRSRHGCPMCGHENGIEKQKLTTEEFVKYAKKVHGDKYDYSKVNYVDYDTPVCIICPKHGEFWQKPSSHYFKHTHHGCPKCGEEMVPSKTTEQFIEQAKSIYGDRYDYSKTNYVNANTKILVICKKHGDFSVKPSYFLNGGCCPFCKKEEKFIKNAKKVHGDKYDYSKVVYKNSDTPVCIIDKERGEFWQKPSRHLEGAGYNVGYSDEKYTKEYCYETAKKYEFFYDFYQKEKKCFLKAKKRGWIEDYTWLKLDSIWTNKQRLIYVYEFDNKIAYVGLTNCLERRDREHRGITKSNKLFVPKNDGVYCYCKENKIIAPAPKILEKNLTIEEAQRQEKYWIKNYIENGWQLLNKCTGGSIGGLPSFCKSGLSIETIIEECKKYKSGEDVKRHNRNLFKAIRKYDLIKICFPQNIHRKPYVYTDDFIEQMVKKYPLKNDLRKHENGVHHYLWEHGLLDKYYPKRLYPPQNNFLKKQDGDDQAK